MNTKAKISSGLVTWGLNGPCGSSGFLIIETNRNKQLTEGIMKRASRRMQEQTLTARRILMIFQPSTDI